MPFMLFDPSMIILIPALIFAMWAQWKVPRTYTEDSKIRASKGRTGRDVAGAILDRNGLTDVEVREVGGLLSDHYDPRTRTVNLSSQHYREPSLAGIAVGAHEVGHAIQHATGYAPLGF